MIDHPSTLYIFPHAGGSARYYVPLARALPSGLKPVAVQYPGRRGTHDVAGLAGIADLAEAVYGRLAAAAPAEGGIALFGHSMGSLVAFEVARRFEAAGRSVAQLFVSACAAPGRAGFDDVPDTDRGLLEAVTRLTGAGPELLENDEFAARILPTLRGFKAITDYSCPPDATVRCPIQAYYADTDQIATYDQVSAWSERTGAAFGIRSFPGHHFYFEDDADQLASDIERVLTTPH
ncbi:thioesterase II family protein [Tsukamurella soli]|uniref:thioesterase II family protein n=1 Tax=Tsukamurella soli TaxID=644556 RepID=UPI0031E82344